MIHFKDLIENDFKFCFSGNITPKTKGIVFSEFKFNKVLPADLFNLLVDYIHVNNPFEKTFRIKPEIILTTTIKHFSKGHLHFSPSLCRRLIVVNSCEIQFIKK